MAVCAVSAVLVAAAGCDSGSGGSQAAGSRTLTIGISSDTSTLDAAECNPQPICFPAYDALVYKSAKGEYQADLATSWKFTDASHRTLRLAIRQGAYFTDGTELDAAAAAASINRFSSVPGTGQSFIYPITKAAAADKYTLDVHYSTPVTLEYALFQLTSQASVGSIIGPEGVRDPKSLETSSDGIGPYKLDPQQTTKGNAYTYVRNPKYFNQDAIQYDKIILKPMTNEASRLSAVQSGQIDWAHNLSERNATTAENAGLRITKNELGSIAALVLMQRKTGPLADVRVRQAISYAVPRDQIVKAVYGSYATPTSSAVSKGAEGYNAADTNMYPHDTAKAKQLLAEAGYPDGFTINVIDIAFFDPGYQLGQALKSALAEVGINLNLTSVNALPGATNEMVMSGKYDAQVSAVSALGTFSLVKVQFEANGAFDPFGADGDATLSRLVESAARAGTEAEQDALMQQATKRLDELAWEIPVASVPTLQVTRSEVRNVPDSFALRELDPFSPVTADNWRSGDK